MMMMMTMMHVLHRSGQLLAATNLLVAKDVDLTIVTILFMFDNYRFRSTLTLLCSPTTLFPVSLLLLCSRCFDGSAQGSQYV